MVKTTLLLPYKITKKYRENQTFSRLFSHKKKRATLYPAPAVTDPAVTFFSILFGTFKYTLYLYTQILVNMTEVHKKYRLTSMEEPTDEMLQALMEDVAKAARESSAKAEAEKQRRFSEVVRIIKARRSQRKKILND